MPRRKKTSTILVPGGAGFIGSHLCAALLRQGHRVICVDSLLTGSRVNLRMVHGHNSFSFIEHDICQPLELHERVDQIYNLACAASPRWYQADPEHTIATCVTGTANLLRLAAEHGARFLQASTSEVYGDPETHPQHEDYLGHVNCTGPRACYDEGKRTAEALCFDALRAGRVDARVARIFNTYGPRMQADDGRIVSNLIVQALRQEPLTIYGTGAQTRSFCFVSDMVAGLMSLMACEPNPGAPVNLGNPDEFSVLMLARMVQRMIPTASRLAHLPLPQDDPRRRRPDITRADALLGWRPKIPLAEGLAETAAWFTLELRRSPPPGERAARSQAAE